MQLPEVVCDVSHSHPYLLPLLCVPPSAWQEATGRCLGRQNPTASQRSSSGQEAPRAPLGVGHMEPAPRCLWEMDIVESCTQPPDTGCSVLLYPLDKITRGLTLLQPRQRSEPHKSDEPGLALPGQPAGKWWAGGRSVSEEGYAKETQSKHSEIPCLCLSSLIFTSPRSLSILPSLPCSSFPCLHPTRDRPSQCWEGSSLYSVVCSTLKGKGNFKGSVKPEVAPLIPRLLSGFSPPTSSAHFF